MSDALTRPTLEIDDDPEAFFELSLAEGWGDGAPLLPPTDERVEALLAATALAPSHVIGKLPPRHGVATVVWWRSTRRWLASSRRRFRW